MLKKKMKWIQKEKIFLNILPYINKEREEDEEFRRTKKNQRKSKEGS